LLWAPIKKNPNPRRTKKPGLCSAGLSGKITKMNGFPSPVKPKQFTALLGEKSEDNNRPKSNIWTYLISPCIGTHFLRTLALYFMMMKNALYTMKQHDCFNPSRAGSALHLSETDKLSFLHSTA